MTNTAEPLESAAEYAAGAPDAVFFVGDSITLGWRDEDIGGWPIRLMGALPGGLRVTSYNLGVRGDTSENIRARWQDEVERRYRDGMSATVVFAFGANDAKLHPDGEPFVPLEATRANAARILEAAVRRYRVLFIGPAPVEEQALARVINPDGNAGVPTNRQIDAVSGVLAGEAARFGVPYFDLARSLSGNEAWMGALDETDGIHPPSRGYDLIAALIGAWEPWDSLFRDRPTP